MTADRIEAKLGAKKLASRSDVLAQRVYYEKSADSYDSAHVVEGSLHDVSLHYISLMLADLSACSVLDVGCGTGRGLHYLSNCHSKIRLIGVDPAGALLRVGASKGIPRSDLVVGDGLSLPFAAGSFDAVIELGMLHHVPRPDLVVREMLRVAKKAVFLSDSNLFGQGRKQVRQLKYVLHRLGLWRAVKNLQTRGRGYLISEGDGISYSYSVYFQYRLLAEWAQHILIMPLDIDTAATRLDLPVFTGATVLLCAIRDARLDCKCFVG
jgi:ubiquinone/menaquinone biosynthesis C-methylase UbiE